jgi:multiple sugar transport system permease protein
VPRWRGQERPSTLDFSWVKGSVRLLKGIKIRRETRTFYALIGLWIVMLLFLNVIPMGYSFYLSLTNFDGIGEPRFIGLRNYTGLLKDYRFLDSIVHTLKFSLFNIVATLTASFLLASLLTKKIKAKGFFRGVLFLPYAVPIIATVFIWKTILNRESGFLNLILGSIKSNFSLDLLVKAPMGSLISMFVWQIGGGMVIFLAGLQNIPRELIEAAEIDGANRFCILRRITIPLLSPVIVYQAVVGIMLSFSVIVQPILLTSSPGAAFTAFLNQQPPYQNYFTLIFAFQQAFTNQSFGVGMAAIWYMFMVMIALSFIFLRATMKYIYYEHE